jgi:hypothetical protein
MKNNNYKAIKKIRKTSQSTTPSGNKKKSSPFGETQRQREKDKTYSPETESFCG